MLVRVVLPIDGWYLIALAVFLTLAKSMRSIDWRAQLGVAGCLSVTWLGGVQQFDNEAWDGIATYWFFFLIGFFLRERIVASAQSLRWATSVALVACWLGTFLVLENVGFSDEPGWSMALRLVALMAGISVATRASSWSWLRRVGQATLPVYVSHILWLALLVGIVTRLPATITHSTWFGAIGPPACAAGAILIGRVVGTVAPRVRAAWLFDVPLWLRRLVWRARREQS
jgi:uncharacterized membrane protein YcfT